MTIIGDLPADYSEGAYKAFRHRLFKAAIDLIVDADQNGKPQRPAGDQAKMLQSLLDETPDSASKGSLNSKYEGKRLPSDSGIKPIEDIKKSLDDPQRLAKKARDADRAVKVENQTGRGGPPDGEYGVDDKAGESYDPQQSNDISKLADSDNGLSIGGRKLAGYIYWCQLKAQAARLAAAFDEAGLSSKLHVAYVDESGNVIWVR